MAQDVSQTGRLHVQPAVHVLSFRCGHLELLVELLHEPGQEGVAGTHGTDAGKAQLSFGSKATGRCNTAASQISLIAIFGSGVISTAGFILLPCLVLSAIISSAVLPTKDSEEQAPIDEGYLSRHACMPAQ